MATCREYGRRCRPSRCVVSPQEAEAADLRAESEVSVGCDIVSTWGAGCGLESQG